MKTPHKHAELIKAWADGADIEHFSVPARLWMYTAHPAWNPENQYRIKPEVKPDTEYWCRTYEHSGGSIFTPHLLSPTEVQPANIKLTFDGETGKLKSAEVL
jgi:hypothetical protein